jgi:hypothetical protein
MDVPCHAVPGYTNPHGVGVTWAWQSVPAMFDPPKEIGGAGNLGLATLLAAVAARHFHAALCWRLTLGALQGLLL